jgi:hypothetical protein
MAFLFHEIMVKGLLHPHRIFAVANHVAFKQASKDSEPEHIAKYHELQKKARKMITAMDKHHRQAYDTMLTDILDDDIEKLDDRDTAIKAANKMTDLYIVNARKALGVGDNTELDQMQEGLILKAYGGETRENLQQAFTLNGKKLDFNLYDSEVRKKLVENVQQNLSEATRAHFKDEHIGDILQYVKKPKFISEDLIRLPEAVPLIDEYDQLKTIVEKNHEKKPYYIKEEKGK